MSGDGGVVIPVGVPMQVGSSYLGYWHGWLYYTFKDEIDGHISRRIPTHEESKKVVWGVIENG